MRNSVIQERSPGKEVGITKEEDVQKEAERIGGIKWLKNRVKEIAKVLMENVKLTAENAHLLIENKTQKELHEDVVKTYNGELQKKEEETNGLKKLVADFKEKVKDLTEKVKNLGEEVLKVKALNERLQKDLDATTGQLQKTEEGRAWLNWYNFSTSRSEKAKLGGAGEANPASDGSSPPDAKTGPVHSYAGADSFNTEKKGRTPRPKGRKNALFLRLRAMLDSLSLSKALDAFRNYLEDLKEKEREVTRIEVLDMIPSFTMELERIRPHANVHLKMKFKIYFKEGEPVIWESPSTLVRRGSTYGGSFVSTAAYLKFFMGMPAERMSKEFQAQGIDLPGASISAALNKSAERYFQPVANYILEQLLKQENAVSDETYMSVFGVEEGSKEEETDSSEEVGNKETGDNQKAKKIKRGVFWVFTTSELSEGNKLVAVAFSKTRGKSFAEEVFKGYDGTLNTDAYCIYKSLAEVTGESFVLCFCWSHYPRSIVIRACA